MIEKLVVNESQISDDENNRNVSVIRNRHSVEIFHSYIIHISSGKMSGLSNISLNCNLKLIPFYIHFL